MSDYAPGDLLVNEKNGFCYIVQDPVRSPRGKLRIKSARAKNVTSAWWAHPEHDGSGPPEGYRLFVRVVLYVPWPVEKAAA